ncbi:MAG: 8-amino-7-oxononanoate synthase [Vampirovibrionales bacterium]|nr:8-amino-7-oxononanoate synthase [Vampirovibrionales bacterium]
MDAYAKQLDVLKKSLQYREVKPFAEGPNSNWVDFSGNDFLGLSQHPSLADAAGQAAKEFGTGATGSRLISGTSESILALEKLLADWKGTEAALVLNSGYQGNIAILQGLLSADDWVFWDRLNHASLVDGVRLSGAKWKRYRHLDLAHLQTLLKAAPFNARKWIVTDSLFSMDGDYPDLPKLCDIAEAYGAFVLVDEAHAGGVFGKEKRSGLCEALGVSSRVTLQVGTFSKALGGFGAYVAGPDVLIKTLINTARGFIYSTALPPSVIAAAHQAVTMVWEDSSLCGKLWENVHFCWSLLERELPPGYLPKLQKKAQKTQIIPVYLPGSDLALRVSERLMRQGYMVRAIRPPTVPKGQERLRIAISAKQTRTQIEGLVSALKCAIVETAVAR